VFKFLIRRARKKPAKALIWKPPTGRMKKLLPWTMRELRPRVTEIRGSSNTHYRSFEIVFDSFRVEIIWRGSELDEVRLKGPNDAIGTRIDYIQKALPRQPGSENEALPLILNYNDLDEFLKMSHRALGKYYRGERVES
jgi:hypothetical protein